MILLGAEAEVGLWAWHRYVRSDKITLMLSGSMSPCILRSIENLPLWLLVLNYREIMSGTLPLPILKSL